MKKRVDKKGVPIDVDIDIWHSFIHMIYLVLGTL